MTGLCAAESHPSASADSDGAKPATGATTNTHTFTPRPKEPENHALTAGPPPPMLSDRQVNAGLTLGLLQGIVPGAAALDATQRAAGVGPVGSPRFERSKFVGQILGGALMTVIGGAGMTGGGALVLSQVGAVIGIPATSMSFGLAAAGVANTLAGWQGLWQSLATGGSAGPPGVSAGPAAPVAGSQSKLAKAMKTAKMNQPPNTDAHHIVAREARGAQGARNILKKFDIDIDDAANGVFLPSNGSSINPNGAAVHSRLHTKEYYNAVEQALGEATSKDDAIKVLTSIRLRLENGGFP